MPALFRIEIPERCISLDTEKNVYIPLLGFPSGLSAKQICQCVLHIRQQTVGPLRWYSKRCAVRIVVLWHLPIDTLVIGLISNLHQHLQGNTICRDMCRTGPHAAGCRLDWLYNPIHGRCHTVLPFDEVVVPFKIAGDASFAGSVGFPLAKTSCNTAGVTFSGS